MKALPDAFMGNDCSEICHGYRKMNADDHVIFYRKKRSGEIEIARILQRRMDIGVKLSVM